MQNNIGLPMPWDKLCYCLLEAAWRTVADLVLYLCLLKSVSKSYASVKVGDESGAIDLYFYQLTAFCTEEGKRLILDQLVYICVLVGLIPLLVTIYVVL